MLECLDHPSVYPLCTQPSFVQLAVSQTHLFFHTMYCKQSVKSQRIGGLPCRTYSTLALARTARILARFDHLTKTSYIVHYHYTPIQLPLLVQFLPHIFQYNFYADPVLLHCRLARCVGVSISLPCILRTLHAYIRL